MSPNIQLLCDLFDAINRADFDAMATFLAPDVLRVEPQGHATAGTFCGADAVRAQVAKGRSTWAEGRCEPEGFVESGERVVVDLHAWVRLHDATEWTGGRFADGFVLRDGKIAEYRTFWSRAEAREWAGVP